jgi:hypothetical protein
LYLEAAEHFRQLAKVFSQLGGDAGDEGVHDGEDNHQGKEESAMPHKLWTESQLTLLEKFIKDGSPSSPQVFQLRIWLSLARERIK